MEDIGYLWTFPESVDELKQKLQYKTYELEVTRKEANEEMKKSNEHIKQLLQLLQTACKERDEAKSQLKKLESLVSYNKLNFDHQLIIPTSAPFSPDSPLLTNYPAKANSGITESNSLSVDTTNNKSCKNPQIQSHVSSPVVDSLFYPSTTSSPDSGINNIVTQTVAVDKGSLVIENLAKGRPLPQKGKLLQAIVEAGPLLQTLMVAGSLPRWRNPPGSVAQPIPPVNIKGCNTNSTTGTTAGVLAHGNVINNNTFGYGHISGGSLGMYTNLSMNLNMNSSPMLDFAGGMSGSLISSSVNFDCQIPKRQRLL